MKVSSVIMRRCAVFAMSLFSLASHAEVRVISPAPGKWCNRQVLVIENGGEKAEVFYSLDGSDPAVSGFAYDGPVLLDKDGDVALKVSYLQGGKRNECTINYSVSARQTNEPFLLGAMRTGFVDCAAGNVLSIPSNLRYSIGGSAFEQGRDVSCPRECILSRTVPIAIDDGRGLYSFVLRVMPVSFGVGKEANVPFSVSGWKEVTLEDTSFIYSIDGGAWRPPTPVGEPIIIDSDEYHTISWQKVDYSEGNEVKSFTLPPIPHLDTKTGEAGDVEISFHSDDDGYAIGLGIDGELSLRKTAILDTIYGDEARGVFPVRVYYKGVYQGAIAIPYNIDYNRPALPVISASAPPASVTRRDVDVTVTGTSGSVLYVSIDGSEYVPANANGRAAETQIRLTTDSIAEHKVSAYSVDINGNTSDLSEYNVTIDKYNYFVDEAHGKEGADGSADSPYSSIAECLSSAGSKAHITVRGAAKMPSTAITAQCTITGEGGDASLFLEGALTIQGDVTLENFIIERDAGADAEAAALPLFDVEGGSLALKGCEVFAVYDTSGNVIKAHGGALAIQNSGVTGKSRISAVAVVSADTSVTIKDSRITAAAMEGVCVSSQGGIVSIDRSRLRVEGKRAHAIELFGTNSRITNNTLEAALTQNGMKSIYCDDKNNMAENSGNTHMGW